MNIFEKQMKQIERKIPHYSYKVELIPINRYILRKFGAFEPFEFENVPKGVKVRIDGKPAVRKPEYRDIPIEQLEQERRKENWSTQFVVYYYDKEETEEERRQEALRFGIKEFEHKLGNFVDYEEYSYGKGWKLCVHPEVEYEHYERLSQITLEEFLNESP